MVQRLGEILFSVPLPQQAVAGEGGFVVCAVLLLLAVRAVPVVVDRAGMVVEGLETPLQQLPPKAEMVVVAVLVVLAGKAVVAAHLRMVPLEPPRAEEAGVMVLPQTLREVVLPTQVAVVVPCRIWRLARIKGSVALVVAAMGDSTERKAPLLEATELPTLVAALAAARQGDPADQAL